MELSNLIPHIEALIFASEKPLSPVEITELINSAFGFMDNKVEEPQVAAALEGIVEKYDSEFYPFEVRQSGGGWQFLTKKDFHKTVAQLNGEKFLKRLSAAALETLAIIAYKQPITKGEIESIRGVSSDYSVQKLLEKELIVISGRNEKLPGHPLVYVTSKSFMDYFGINSADDLPRIKEVLSEQMVLPTMVTQADFEQSNLVVTDEGELLIPDEDGTNPEAEGSHINGHHFDEQDPDFIDPSAEEELSEEDFQVDADADAATGDGSGRSDDRDEESGDSEDEDDESTPLP